MKDQTPVISSIERLIKADIVLSQVSFRSMKAYVNGEKQGGNYYGTFCPNQTFAFSCIKSLISFAKAEEMTLTLNHYEALNGVLDMTKKMSFNIEQRAKDFHSIIIYLRDLCEINRSFLEIDQFIDCATSLVKFYGKCIEQKIDFYNFTLSLENHIKQADILNQVDKIDQVMSIIYNELLFISCFKDSYEYQNFLKECDTYLLDFIGLESEIYQIRKIQDENIRKKGPCEVKGEIEISTLLSDAILSIRCHSGEPTYKPRFREVINLAAKEYKLFRASLNLSF